jgi:hypothetical protein
VLRLSFTSKNAHRPKLVQAQNHQLGAAPFMVDVGDSQIGDMRSFFHALPKICWKMISQSPAVTNSLLGISENFEKKLTADVPGHTKSMEACRSLSFYLLAFITPTLTYESSPLFSFRFID